MERKSVVSGNIAEVGYDHDSLVLEIKFQKGGVYHYTDVDFGTYNGLMSAESPGRYFREYVLGKFPGKKVE